MSNIPRLAKMYPARHKMKTSRIDCATSSVQDKHRHVGTLRWKRQRGDPQKESLSPTIGTPCKGSVFISIERRATAAPPLIPCLQENIQPTAYIRPMACGKNVLYSPLTTVLLLRFDVALLWDRQSKSTPIWPPKNRWWVPLSLLQMYLSRMAESKHSHFLKLPTD